MARYDDLSREELIRLLQARDRRDAVDEPEKKHRLSAGAPHLEVAAIGQSLAERFGLRGGSVI